MTQLKATTLVGPGLAKTTNPTSPSGGGNGRCGTNVNGARTALGTAARQHRRDPVGRQPTLAVQAAGTFAADVLEGGTCGERGEASKKIGIKTRH